VPGEPGRVSSQTLGEISHAFFHKNILQMRQPISVTLRVDSFAFCKIINEENAVLIQKKIEASYVPNEFCSRIILVWVSRYAATTLIVALSRVIVV
jgi:hypothetical protein